MPQIVDLAFCAVRGSNTQRFGLVADAALFARLSAGPSMRVQNLEHALQLETRRAVQPAIGLAEPQRPFARLAPGRVFTGEREERLHVTFGARQVHASK